MVGFSERKEEGRKKRNTDRHDNDNDNDNDLIMMIMIMMVMVSKKERKMKGRWGRKEGRRPSSRQASKLQDEGRTRKLRKFPTCSDMVC